MRKLLNVILCFIGSIIIVLGLAFIFIEGRLIFSLDWIIYDNKFNGLLRYSLRLILACLAIVICIFEMINIRRSNKDISDYLLFSDGGLVVASIVLLINTTNYINIICIVLSSILFLTKIGLYKIQE
jgi:hypothetical protein